MLGVGPDFVDQADGQRLGAGQGLRPQDQVERPVPADAARQSCAAAPGRHGPQVQFGQADAGAVLGGEPEVAGQWQLQAAT
jgi:hypothetical protein